MSSIYLHHRYGFSSIWPKKIVFSLKNDFLKKLRSLPNLPDDIILYTVRVVDLYLNIPRDEGLFALRKRLYLRQEKDVTTSKLL